MSKAFRESLRAPGFPYEYSTYYLPHVRAENTRLKLWQLKAGPVRRVMCAKQMLSCPYLQRSMPGFPLGVKAVSISLQARFWVLPSCTARTHLTVSRADAANYSCADSTPQDLRHEAAVSTPTSLKPFPKHTVSCAKGPISLSAWVRCSLVAGKFGWGIGF